MGDRCNIVMQYDQNPNSPKGTPPPRVYFYGHWSGEEAPEALQRALAKRWRWDDESYLARIIFCEFVKGDEAEEIGFGISPFICDNEHSVIVVDVPRQQVRFEREPGPDGSPGEVLKTYTFEQYVKLQKPFYPEG